MSQVPAAAWTKRSFDRWSPEETYELIKAWAPVHLRRRRGTKDAWVPLHIRGRSRSSRALVTEDWRGVASAVNSYRAIVARRDSCRTYLQCKDRVKTLKWKYMKGQAGPFFSVLHAVFADEVVGVGAGSAEGRRAPAGDAGGTAAAGAYDGAAAGDGGSGAGNADSGTAAVDDFGPSGDERRIAMLAAAEGASAGNPCRGSAMEAPDGAVVIDGRTSDDITHNQWRRRVKPLGDIYEKKHEAAVGEERGGVEDASEGASVDGRGAAAEAARCRATFVPPPIPKRPRSAKPVAPFANMAVDLSAEALAVESTDAVVMMKLAEEMTKLAGMYKELRMKTLDVEREKAARAGARRGA